MLNYYYKPVIIDLSNIRKNGKAYTFRNMENAMAFMRKLEHETGECFDYDTINLNHYILKHSGIKLNG